MIKRIHENFSNFSFFYRRINNQIVENLSELILQLWKKRNQIDEQDVQVFRFHVAKMRRTLC